MQLSKKSENMYEYEGVEKSFVSGNYSQGNKNTKIDTNLKDVPSTTNKYEDNICTNKASSLENKIEILGKRVDDMERKTNSVLKVGYSITYFCHVKCILIALSKLKLYTCVYFSFWIGAWTKAKRYLH